MTVNYAGYTLRFASPSLQNDEEIVRTAIIWDSSSFQYASDKLKNDYNFLLHIVKIAGDVLLFASERMKDNKKLALISFKNVKTINFIIFQKKLEMMKKLCHRQLKVTIVISWIHLKDLKMIEILY